MRTSTNAWAMLIPRMAPGMPLLSCNQYSLGIACSIGVMMHMLMLRTKVANITTRFNISKMNCMFCGTLKMPWST